MEKDHYYRFVKERLSLFQEVLQRDTLRDDLMWRIEPKRVRRGICRNSEFFKLLLKHHFPHWLEEARKSVTP